MKNKLKLAVLFLAVFAISCATMNSVVNVAASSMISLDEDKQMGNQMFAQIQADRTEYPILDPVKYKDAYTHINRIMSTILNSGQVNYVNDFEWSVQLIDADVLNAFACPGGKMYVYTGLVKYLDNEAQLAGVMGHEIAHVHCRHSSAQIMKQYGVDYLTNVALGKSKSDMVQLLGQISGQASGLAFSRADESQADALAVKFLSHTDYNPLGVGGFFEKLQKETGSQSALETFMSTHPAPANRVKNIHDVWVQEGSKKGNDFVDRYQQFKKSLTVASATTTKSTTTGAKSATSTKTTTKK